MELIEKVKEAKKVLKDAQNELLKFCRDKNYPITERWNAWVKYVDKEDHGYISCNGSKTLQNIIDYWTDGREISRHETVDYAWILDSLTEDTKHLAKIQSICRKNTIEVRDKKIDSIINDGKSFNGVSVIIPQNIDELIILLQEEIMIANFGSFEFDW